jgi:hypothetical protein
MDARLGCCSNKDIESTPLGYLASSPFSTISKHLFTNGVMHVHLNGITGKGPTHPTLDCSDCPFPGIPMKKDEISNIILVDLSTTKKLLLG